MGPEYLVKRSAEEADAEEAYLKLLEHAYKKGHPIRTPPPVAIATKRREQAIKKLPAIVDFCKNFLDSSESLVVFAYHRDVISALETQLEEFLPAVIHGGTSESDRAKAVKDFQSGATSLFIGQLTAAELESHLPEQVIAYLQSWTGIRPTMTKPLVVSTESDKRITATIITSVSKGVLTSEWQP